MEKIILVCLLAAPLQGASDEQQQVELQEPLTRNQALLGQVLDNNRDLDVRAKKPFEEPSINVILDMYNQLQMDSHQEPVNLGNADTVHAFQATVTSVGRKTTLTFSLEAVSPEEIPEKVELRIRPCPHCDLYKNMTNIRIRITLDTNADNQFSLLQNLESQVTNNHISLDLSETVKKLVKLAGNLTPQTLIKVSFTNPRVTRMSNTDSGEENDIAEAVLVIFSQDKEFMDSFNQDLAKVRSTISARRKRFVASTEGCTKHQYVVDFKEIGWHEMVLWPKTYKDNYCVGPCRSPFRYSDNATIHAIIQSLTKSRARGLTNIPETSCVPTKLAPLSFLSFKGGAIVLKNNKNTIAKECGCS